MSEEKELELNIAALKQVPVQVSVVLGKTTMQLSKLLKLNKGAVIELERNVGEPIDVYVNNRMVARGEIVIVENKIGVTLTEVISVDSIQNV